MRKFKVNVNGVAYTVEVAEEGVVAAAPQQLLLRQQ